MTTAQGYVVQDSGFYFAKQSVKGTNATTFKGGIGVASYTVEPVRVVTRGVAMLGTGTWRGQQIGTSTSLTWRVSGWGTMRQLSAFLTAMGVKGSSTTLATSGFTHPITMNTRNRTKKYLSLAFVEGETAVGTGLLKHILRDCIIASAVFTLVGNQAFTFELNGLAINEGPGATGGGVTFSFTETLADLHTPNFSNSLNAITYPSFVATAFCTTSLTITYSADLSLGPNCLGTSEPSDIYTDNESWSFKGAAIAETNYMDFYRLVNYGTTTPGNDTSQLTAAIKSGAFNILVNSDDIIPSSSPATNYSIAFNFPNVQFTKAILSPGTPVTGEYEAETFDSAANIAIGNDLSSASQTI